jgi:Predicted membrane protein
MIRDIVAGPPDRRLSWGSKGGGMALVACVECGREVSDKAAVCVGCGAPMAEGKHGLVHHVVVDRPAKSRGAYIVLGLFFGGIGIHNFYAGQLASGAIKIALLAITLLLDMSTGFYTGFVLLAAVLNCTVALLEIILRKVDGQGRDME